MNYIKLIAASLVLMSSAALAQVNINTATAKELTALMGIGPIKAEAIIEYRQANGKFNTVNDLTKVSGIGKKTVENLGEDIQTHGKTDISKLKN